LKSKAEEILIEFSSTKPNSKVNLSLFVDEFIDEMGKVCALYDFNLDSIMIASILEKLDPIKFSINVSSFCRNALKEYLNGSKDALKGLDVEVKPGRVLEGLNMLECFYKRS
jgi:hypothetical protein